MMYLTKSRSSFATQCMLLGVSFAVTGLTLVVSQLPPEIADSNPCEHPDAIQLPSSDKCVVPVRQAQTWATAQSMCEQADGKLYQLPTSLQSSNSPLIYCIASRPKNNATSFWINAVAVWSPQFHWVNGSEVSPVRYCTRQRPPDSGGISVESAFLSVDYCVATCHESSATYIVIHNTDGIPRCYCFFLSSPQEAIICDTTGVSYANRTHYFIAEARQDAIIRVANTNTINRLEILCATVDTETQEDRLMRSESCFHSRGFICNLGRGGNCPQESCTKSSCHFLWKGQCLKRDDSSYNWYEARSLCANEGGDLWIMDKMDDMLKFNQYITDGIRYWIGASNFQWNNNSDSGAIARYQSTNRNVRCGHLNVDSRTGRWAWNQTSCDAEHPFLCQFDKGSSDASKIDDDVTCPWPITVRPTHNSHDNHSFPLAATISGIVAGLVLLTAFLVGFTYCCRRQWIYSKLKKAREYLAFIPYFADSNGGGYAGHGSGVEFESMSNAGHNMSYMSDHCSQTGLVKGGYPNAYALTNSYRDSSVVYSDKSLDKRHKDSMQRKLNDSQNFLASQNTSMDDTRGFSTTYSTLLARSNDFMTLEGEMNIQDDPDGLRGTLRGKPEVTLVTDHADLNFTVNRAYPQGHPDMSRVSLDRTMEEITLPPTEGGLSVPLPDRVAEARVMSSLAHHEV